MAIVVIPSLQRFVKACQVLLSQCVDRVADATAQAVAAASSAGAALAAKLAAELARNNAQAHEVSAMGYASSAATSAAAAAAAVTIYANDAAGIAATTNGQFFWTPGATGVSALDLKKNNAGVAQYITSTPSVSLLDSRLARRAGGPQLVGGLDATGNYHWLIDRNRIKHPAFDAVKAVLSSISFLSSTARKAPGGAQQVLTGSNLGQYMRVTPRRLRHPEFDSVRRRLERLELQLQAVRRRMGDADGALLLNAIASCIAVIYVGQSNGTGTGGTPPVTTSTLPYSLTFNDGVNMSSPYVASPAYTPLVGHYERGNETPMAAFAQCFVQLLREENGIDLSSYTQALFLCASAAVPGTNITQLQKGQANDCYTRLVSLVTNGLPAVQALGRSLSAIVLLGDHGESDINASTARNTYANLYRALRSDFEADANAITGGAGNVKLIMRQVTSHLFYSKPTPTIALAQLDMHADPHAMVACADYFADYGDDVHRLTRGHRHVGALKAVAFKRWICEGTKPPAFVPVSAVRSGDRITLKYPVQPGRKLVLDTTTVANPGQYGIDAVDGSGSNIAIAGIRLEGTDRIVLTFSSSGIAATVDKVRNAWRGTGYRGVSCVRDDAGDSLIFDRSGSAIPLHNWSLISETTVI